MTWKSVALLAIAGLVASAAYAESGCDPAVTRALKNAERMVDTLRPDKSGQARVFAPDGSEFTAGQTLWMRNQLRQVGELCARGDQPEAARRLGAVEQLLRAHRPPAG